MKNSFVLVFSFIALLQANAQEKNDTVKIKWGQSRILIFKDTAFVKKDTLPKPKRSFKKKEFVHWAGIDLGVAMLSTYDNRFFVEPQEDSLKSMLLNLKQMKSTSFSINFGEQNIRLYKNYINIVTGLGINWVSYSFRKPFTLNPNVERIKYANTAIAPDSISFRKNKLNITYIKVPLLIEINTNSENPNKSFHIAGGVELSYRLLSKTKQIFTGGGVLYAKTRTTGSDGEYRYKVKRRDDYNLNDLLLNATLRFGYGNTFTFYANYGLSQLFKYKEGPSIYPLSAGVCLTL
jgi:hypothetical protein